MPHRVQPEMRQRRLPPAPGMNTKRSRLLDSVLILFSVLGFVAQVVQVSNQYFRFDTSTQVTFSRTHYVRDHNIGLCIRFSDLLDTGRLFNETGIRYDPDVAPLSSGEYENEGKLTVAQVLEYTPPADRFIDFCFSRSYDWRITKGSSGKCATLFNVTKFFTLQYICYKVQTVQRKKKLALRAVVNSAFETMKIWQIVLTKDFARANIVYPVAFMARLPYVSRKNSQILPPLKKGPRSNETFVNTLLVTPSDTKMTLLPPPYNTRCDARQASGNRHVCRTKCLVKAFKPLNRLPGWEMLAEGSADLKLKPVSFTDMRDKGFRNRSKQAIADCSDKCASSPCQQNYAVTTTVTGLDAGVALKLASVVSYQADTIITTIVSMSMINYFSFVCGCFGTWFGISFLSVLRYCKQRVERRCEKSALVVRFPERTIICTTKQR